MGGEFTLEIYMMIVLFGYRPDVPRDINKLIVKSVYVHEVDVDV